MRTGTKIRNFKIKKPDYALLGFSVVALYLLAPALDRAQGILLSLAFGLVQILSSRREPARRFRYAAYILIAVGSHLLLFAERLWDLILRGGVLESSLLPFIVSSVIMSWAGGLLLAEPRQRYWYWGITLGLQLPVAMLVGTEGMQDLLTEIAQVLGYNKSYSENYPAALQAWQFGWMLTYYLPVFFLSRRGGGDQGHPLGKKTANSN